MKRLILILFLCCVTNLYAQVTSIERKRLPTHREVIFTGFDSQMKFYKDNGNYYLKVHGINLEPYIIIDFGKDIFKIRSDIGSIISYCNSKSNEYLEIIDNSYNVFILSMKNVKVNFEKPRKYLHIESRDAKAIIHPKDLNRLFIVLSRIS